LETQTNKKLTVVVGMNRKTTFCEQAQLNQTFIQPLFKRWSLLHEIWSKETPK